MTPTACSATQPLSRSHESVSSLQVNGRAPELNILSYQGLDVKTGHCEVIHSPNRGLEPPTSSRLRWFAEEGPAQFAPEADVEQPLVVRRRFSPRWPLVALVIDHPSLVRESRHHGGLPEYRSIIEAMARGRRWIGTVFLWERILGACDRLAGTLIRMGLRVVVWQGIDGDEYWCRRAQLLVEGMRLLAQPGLEEVALVGGGAHLTALAVEAKELGLDVTLASFSSSYAVDISHVADRLVALDTANILRRRQVVEG